MGPVADLVYSARDPLAPAVAAKATRNSVAVVLKMILITDENNA
jgi:hypothetical protein